MDMDVLNGVWDIVPTPASPQGSARHAARMERVAFGATSGEISLDLGDASESSIDLSVSVESIATGDDARDQRLRSRYFFNGRKHPQISFTGEEFDEIGDGTFLVTGNLSIRGVTRRVTMPISVVRMDKGDDGRTALALVAARRLDLADFRAEAADESSEVAAADRLDLEIAITAVRRDAASLMSRIREAS